MSSTRRSLLTVMTMLMLGIVPASVQAAVTVSITGTDSGDNPNDTLRITGDDTQNSLIVREGFEGDVGADGKPDSCGGDDRLCFLTVEATLGGPVTPQGACQRAGSENRVRCAYFHSGTARSTHVYNARIDLLGGVNDRVQITQDAVRDCCQALTTPWNWKIDYGAQNEVIRGEDVLTVPDERGTVTLTVAGGGGSDFFQGRFAARPTTLMGDDINNAVNVTGTDRFANISGGFGLAFKGQGGDDTFVPSRTSIPIDAGPGNDLVSFEEASFDSLGPATSLDGGPGTDTIGYGQSAPSLTLFLDGSSTSTGNNVLTNFENASGSPHKDTINGTDQPNQLTGNGGFGDILRGFGGNDRLDVDDPNPVLLRPGSTDDTATGGAGEDLILGNDGMRDVVDCGTSSHTQTFFFNNQPMQITVFDSDRARIDLADTERDCEDVQREPVRTPPAAEIRRVKLKGDAVRVLLRCPRKDRNGCDGRARVGRADAVDYDVGAGKRERVRMPLPRAVRQKLDRRGYAVVRVVVREKDSKGRDRTRRKTVVLHRR